MSYAHLPNAPHIDRVLAHAKNHPKKWGAAWDAARDAARDAAWDAALAAARDGARDGARDAARAAWTLAWANARDAVRVDALNAAWSALSALTAWDDASVFLDQDPDVLRMAAAAGNPAAVLLLPAAIAMQGGTP